VKYIGQILFAPCGGVVVCKRQTVRDIYKIAQVPAVLFSRNNALKFIADR